MPLINLIGLNPLGLKIGDHINSSIKRVRIKGCTVWTNFGNDKSLGYPPLVLDSNHLRSGGGIATSPLRAI